MVAWVLLEPTKTKLHTNTHKGTIMTGKNPFQIRSEVLELAKDYMDTQHQLNLEYIQKKKALGKVERDDYLEAFKPYAFDDLMEKAKEMYNFISNKD
jgi:hypothetical protein